MKSRVVTVVASLIAVAACGPTAPQFTPADEQAVMAEAQKVPGLFVKADFAGWAAQFEENGLLQPPNGKSAQGRAGLQEWAKSFPPLDAAKFYNDKVRGEGNWAYYTSDYTITIKGVAMPDTGKQLAVFHRQTDGKWLVAAVSFNSDLPPAPPPPPPGKATAKK